MRKWSVRSVVPLLILLILASDLSSAMAQVPGLPGVPGLPAMPVPGSTPAPETPSQTINKGLGFWEILTGKKDDPNAYFFLFPIAVELGLVAARGLFTSIPQAYHAVRDLKNIPMYRRQLGRFRDAYREVRNARPGYFAALDEVRGRYDQALEGVGEELRKLPNLDTLKNDPAARRDAERAVKDWDERRDLSGLQAWEKRYRKHLKNGSGKQWLRDYRERLAAEALMADLLIDKGNAITEELNRRMADGEAFALLTHDAQGKRVPGRFYVASLNTSVSPDRFTSLLKADRCDKALEALLTHRRDYAAKGGVLGIINHAMTIAKPFVTFGGAGYFGYLSWRSYQRSKEIYGKDPASVKSEEAHRDQVRQEAKLRTEASVESQMVNRRAEYQNFTDTLVNVLHDNRDMILQAAQNYSERHPDARIDLDKKRLLLADKQELQYHVLRTLPAATQQGLNNPSVDQFLKFLSVAKSDPRVTLTTEDFLDAFYGQFLDKIFPEIKTTLVHDNEISHLRASHYIGGRLTGELTRRTLPLMKTINVTVPKDVPPHSSYPPDPAGTAPPPHPLPGAQARATQSTPSVTPAGLVQRASGQN